MPHVIHLAITVGDNPDGPATLDELQAIAYNAVNDTATYFGIVYEDGRGDGGYEGPFVTDIVAYAGITKQVPVHATTLVTWETGQDEPVEVRR